MSVSFTVCMDFGFCRETDVHQTDDFIDPSRIDEMCRGSNVKDSLVTGFQLESLILAQNERWRQA